MLVIVALVAKPELFEAQAAVVDAVLATIDLFDRKR